MPEPLHLELPTFRPRKKSSVFLRLLPLWVLLAGIAVFLLWPRTPEITSAWAVLDGPVRPIVSDFSARLDAVFVHEGDSVKQGQILARMDTSAFARHFADAGRETAALRAASGPPGPPDMEEMAQRLKDAQETERNMTRRIALARHEEEMRRRAREDRVAEHVRAQLYRRTLDSRGGEYAVGKTAYAAAREAEARAKNAMDDAAAAFEAYSRERAALDQELTRIREEILRYKQLASRNRYEPHALAAASPASPATPAQKPDGNLYAPQDGRILPGMAAVGQIIQRGEPVLVLLPATQGTASATAAMAYFAPQAGMELKVGQACSVALPEGVRLDGKIQEVLPKQPLPVSAPQTENATTGNATPENAPQDTPRRAASPNALTPPHAPQASSLPVEQKHYVPVRISLEATDTALVPGTIVTCTVKSSLWSRLF